MNYLLTIYSVCFLSFGNILFSQFHHFLAHNHCHETNFSHQDCDECAFLENNDNLYCDIFIVCFIYDELLTDSKILNLAYNSDSIEVHPSRAPPIL